MATFIESDSFTPTKPKPVSFDDSHSNEEAVYIQSEPFARPVVAQRVYKKDKDAVYIESDVYVAPAQLPQADMEDTSRNSAVVIESDPYVPAPVNKLPFAEHANDDAVYIDSEPYVKPQVQVAAPRASLDDRDTAVFVESEPFAPPPKKPVAFASHDDGAISIESDPYVEPAQSSSAGFPDSAEPPKVVEAPEGDQMGTKRTCHTCGENYYAGTNLAVYGCSCMKAEAANMKKAEERRAKRADMKAQLENGGGLADLVLPAVFVVGLCTAGFFLYKHIKGGKTE